MNDLPYTPICKTAVASLVLAVLSLGGLIFHPLALLAVPGAVCGIIALREIRIYALGGRRLALWGLPLSLAVGFGGPMLEVNFYRLEAPAGYRRLDYSSNLDEGDLDQYVGQEVCLKGYAPGKDQSEVSQFILTCNGYSRDPRNPILVELADGRVWEMTFGGVAVSGRMELLPPRADIADFPRYVLRDADCAPSRTLHQLATRDTSEGC